MHNYVLPEPEYYCPHNDGVMTLAYENLQSLIFSKLDLGDKISRELKSPRKWKWNHLWKILQTAKEKKSLIMLNNQIPEHHEFAGMLLSLGIPGAVQFNYMQSVVSLAKLDVLNATNGTKGRELGKRAGTHTVQDFEKETHSGIFDFSGLPVPQDVVFEFLKYIYSLFPLAFRAPGVPGLPEFMKSNDNHTTQIVCPPSGDPFFTTMTEAKASGEYLWQEPVGLFCTSANPSSDTVGYKKVPPHTNPKALFQELYSRDDFNRDHIVPFFSISDSWPASVEKMEKFKKSAEGVIISSTTNLFLDPELQKGGDKVILTCGRNGSVPQEALKKAINEGPYRDYFEFVEADLPRLPERAAYSPEYLSRLENSSRTKE